MHKKNEARQRTKYGTFEGTFYRSVESNVETLAKSISQAINPPNSQNIFTAIGNLIAGKDQSGYRKID